jgi:hypothetical protein
VSPLFRFLDADKKEAPHAQLTGVQKAPRHEVAGSWGLSGSECYGDCMSAAISMVDATPARGGGHAEFINRRLGGLMDDIGLRDGKPYRRMLPQLSRFGMNVAK